MTNLVYNVLLSIVLKGYSALINAICLMLLFSSAASAAPTALDRPTPSSARLSHDAALARSCSYYFEDWHRRSIEEADALLHDTASPRALYWIVKNIREGLEESHQTIHSLEFSIEGLRRYPEGHSLLQALSFSSVHSWRFAALLTLTKLGQATAFENLLTEVVSAPNFPNAHEAVLELGRHQYAAAIPVFRELISSRVSQELTESAMVALALLQDRPSIPIISRLVTDEDLRSTAIESLLYLGVAPEKLGAKRSVLSKSSPSFTRALQVLGAKGHRAALRELARGTNGGRRQKLSDDAVEAARHSIFAGTGNFSMHPLYRDVDPKSDFFNVNGPIRTVEMKKTGSRNILLGGPLAGKVFMRVVSLEAYAAWKAAAQAVETWKNAGFDYVPVEPMLTRAEVDALHLLTPSQARQLDAIEYGLEESSPNQAVVYTKVLGLNIYNVEASVSSVLTVKLEHEAARIVSTLVGLGIRHGHTHSANFCIDTEISNPKLYLIDFDMARFVE